MLVAVSGVNYWTVTIISIVEKYQSLDFKFLSGKMLPST